ncbi:hypothetical protein DDQ50_00845 [Amnibacterium flavum]|uniref:Uncharacterized protein n=1 Tax=Amnibacterium flavum TaxID=2173173 RepID=A0A2V1HTV2_9MICO|nr:hypothetical protein DDQ50_00845 [Amnibacterium flavum]
MQDTATRPCVLVDSAAGGTPMAVTGFDLVLPIAVAAALLILGVALVVAARRRRAENDATSARPLISSIGLAAIIAVGFSGAMLLASTTSAHAAEQTTADASTADDCDLISYSIDRRGAGSVLLGSSLVETERVTVTNVTNGTISIAFSTDILDDVRQLAPFVHVTAACGCTGAPLIDGVLSANTAISAPIRLRAGEALTVTMQAATTASITNDLQGSELTYALVAHAMEVSA